MKGIRPSFILDQRWLSWSPILYKTHCATPRDRFPQNISATCTVYLTYCTLITNIKEIHVSWWLILLCTAPDYQQNEAWIHCVALDDAGCHQGRHVCHFCWRQVGTAIDHLKRCLINRLWMSRFARGEIQHQWLWLQKERTGLEDYRLLRCPGEHDCLPV